MATILTKISSLDSTWLTTIVIAACTLFLAKFWLRIKSYPPGPIPIPLLGNLLSFRTQEHAFSVIDIFRKKYGDMFTLWLGAEPVVIVCDWNLMKEALITKSRDFSGRQKRIMTDIASGGHDDVFFGDFGPKWEYLKKIATSAVRKYTISEKFRNSVCSAADEMIERMINEKQPLDPEDQVFFAIHNVIAQAAFGRRYEEHDREYIELKSSSEMLANEFSVGLPSDILPLLRPFYWNKEQRLRKRISQLRSVVFEKYKDHAKTYQPGKIRAFTDAVIAARKEAEIEENAILSELNDYNFMNIISDLFLAGTHTTMTSIMWMLLLLGHYEDVQKKIVTEIDEIVGSRMPTQKDKAKCHYTSAVIMEAQRFKTIVPLGLDHKTTCDTELGGYPIKKDTTVVFHLLAHHMDPNNWPEPMKFKPERFLEDGGTLSKVRKDAYVPFSAGRRNCLGEKLALTEIFLIIVRVLQKCKITLPNGPGTADLGLMNQIMFCQPKPFQICMHQRNDFAT